MIYQALKKNAIVIVSDLKGVDFLKWNNYKGNKPLCVSRNQLEKQCEIVTNLEDTLEKLKNINEEFIARKILFSNLKVENIKEYYKIQNDNTPINRIIFILDEVAMLSLCDDKNLTKNIEDGLIKIATQGRAFGIHLILSTQRPDCKLLEGQIKSNLDVRICGRTSDRSLSEVVLGKGNYDADRLIGKKEVGLFATNNNEIFRGYWFDIDKAIAENNIKMGSIIDNEKQ